MSDEQPNFKVTDRRLFNADGSPRDLPPEERPEPKPETVTATAATAAAGAQTETAASSQTEAAAASPPPAEAVGETAGDMGGEIGGEVDVELGKHWIDVLGMLQKKTAGNLSSKEQQMLEGLLADLRMQYVSLTNVTPRSQRFSGSDITGGR